MASAPGVKKAFSLIDGVLSKVVFHEGKPCSARTLDEFEIFLAGPCLRGFFARGTCF
jgi:hypothetical protein